MSWFCGVIFLVCVILSIISLFCIFPLVAGATEYEMGRYSGLMSPAIQFFTFLWLWTLRPPQVLSHAIISMLEWDITEIQQISLQRKNIFCFVVLCEQAIETFPLCGLRLASRDGHAPIFANTYLIVKKNWQEWCDSGPLFFIPEDG